MSDETKVISKNKLNKKLLIGIAVFIAVALLAILAIFIPKAANAKKASEQLSLGDKYLSELKYEQAEVAYLAVIEIDPKNVDAYLGLADVYVAQGEYDKAIVVLEDALEELDGDAAKTVKDKLNEVQSAKVDATTSESTETNAPGQEAATNSAPTAAPTEVATPSEKPSPKNQLASAQIGDVVTFGRFVQSYAELDLEKVSADERLRNQYNTIAEEMEWYVLDRKEDKVLLFSKYVVDTKPYHMEHTEITWAQSSIREWLNSTFYSLAFDEEEKKYICNTKLSNPDNIEFDSVSIGGGATVDNVFLLSIEEAKKYFNYTYDDSSMSGFEEYEKTGLDKRLLGVVTDYAIINGSGNYAIDNSEDCSTWWYLRSMRRSNLYPAQVAPWGEISAYGTYLGYVEKMNGIRPAIWVDIEGSTDAIFDLANGEEEGTGRMFHSLKANTEELLSFEELNFLGHSIGDFDIDTVRSLLEENNYSVNCNLEWEDPDETDYVWLGGYPGWYENAGIADISAMQYDEDDYVCLLGYTQWTHDNEKKSPVGVRNINMHDTFGEVMEKLGFYNAYEVEADIEYFFKEYIDYEKFDAESEKYWNVINIMTEYNRNWAATGLTVSGGSIGWSMDVSNDFSFDVSLHDTLFQKENDNRNYSVSLSFDMDEYTNGKFILTDYTMHVNER